VSNRTLDVIAKESLIKFYGGGEFLNKAVRGFTKPATPQLGAFIVFAHA
jgi:hypothetical protein